MLDNKWIGALFTLIINLGSSYVVNDVHKIFDGIFSFKAMKWLVVFAICLAATQDIYVSICISIMFSIFVWVLLDFECEMCLPRVRKFLRKHLLEIDEDDDYEFEKK